LKIGASIITNFGCDTGCEYCIWNQHPLKKCYTTVENTNWTKLESFVKPYKKISVSGGGDPFFKYELNKGWFDRLFDIYTGMIDVHTSKILNNSVLKKLISHISSFCP